jgi:MYXO-CTERM domain-containing protein
MSSKLLTASVLVALAAAVPATAAINITQGSSAPTYSTTLNFDEPGAPTGANVAGNAFAAFGMSELISGEGSNFVGDVSGIPGYGWVGSSNVFVGPFGVFMMLDTDVTAFSMQFFDNSGPSTGFAGGAIIAVFNNGDEVGSYFIENPAYGGFGDSWFDIVATDGMVFDEVRALGFGFGPESIVDNLSWNAVPTPGAAALLALGGLTGLRRRRA